MTRQITSRMGIGGAALVPTDTRKKRRNDPMQVAVRDGLNQIRSQREMSVTNLADLLSIETGVEFAPETTRRNLLGTQPFSNERLDAAMMFLSVYNKTSAKRADYAEKSLQAAKFHFHGVKTQATPDVTGLTGTYQARNQKWGTSLLTIHAHDHGGLIVKEALTRGSLLHRSYGFGGVTVLAGITLDLKCDSSSFTHGYVSIAECPELWDGKLVNRLVMVRTGSPLSIALGSSNPAGTLVKELAGDIFVFRRVDSESGVVNKDTPPRSAEIFDRQTFELDA